MALRRIARLSTLAALALTLVVVTSVSAATTELYAKLSGSAEVPKASGGSGRAEVKLNKSTGKVCWSFTRLKGISSTTAAHIHKGAKGKAGPVVVPFGASFKAKGCTTASKSAVAAILKRPGSYYVNIHTKKYAAGAIRGQLSKTE